MARNFDARALKCPWLLVKTKLLLRQLAAGETLSVLVSSPVGINDIRRYLDAQGFSYTMTPVEPPAVMSGGNTDMQFSIKGKET